MERTHFFLGALFGLLGVAMGAMGAHALEARLTPDRLDTFELAARYQLYHALALLATAWATTRWPGGAAHLAGWFFVAGILLFSGSLYVLALGGPRWVAFITPFGGVSFLIGWHWVSDLAGGLLAGGLFLRLIVDWDIRSRRRAAETRSEPHPARS